MPSQNHKQDSVKKLKKTTKGAKPEEAQPTQPILNNEVNPNGNADKECEIKKREIIVTIPENNRGNDQEVIANRLFKKSIFINAIMLFATLIIAGAAVYQYSTSKSAAEIAERTFKETKKYDSASLAIQQKTFNSNDSDSKARYKRDTSFFKLQEKAFNDEEQRFENENKPYFEIYEVTIKFIQIGKTIPISFAIYNLGKQPTKIISLKTAIVYSNIYEYKKEPKNYINIPVNFYIAYHEKVTFTPNVIDTVTTKMFNEIMAGKKFIYIFGQCDYINSNTNKKSTYRFKVRVSYEPEFGYKSIYNKMK